MLQTLTSLSEVGVLNWHSRLEVLARNTSKNLRGSASEADPNSQHATLEFLLRLFLFHQLYRRGPDSYVLIAA
jgi:hypothetical protein